MFYLDLCTYLFIVKTDMSSAYKYLFGHIGIGEKNNTRVCVSSNSIYGKTMLKLMIEYTVFRRQDDEY